MGKEVGGGGLMKIFDHSREGELPKSGGCEQGGRGVQISVILRERNNCMPPMESLLADFIQFSSAVVKFLILKMFEKL